MNKLVPLSKFSKRSFNFPGAFVIVNKKGAPVGYAFGNDAFISLLSRIDDQFESLAKDQDRAHYSIAGKIIDIIEEKLPLNPEFVKDLDESIKEARKEGWIPFNQVQKMLNV